MSDCIDNALDTTTKLTFLISCLHFFCIIALYAITAV